MEEINEVKLLLNQEFDMKDLGVARRILGIGISRDRDETGYLFVGQTKYTNKILKRFKMDSAKQTTPIAQHFKLSGKDSPNYEASRQAMNNVPYANATGIKRIFRFRFCKWN